MPLLSAPLEAPPKNVDCSGYVWTAIDKIKLKPLRFKEVNGRMKFTVDANSTDSLSAITAPNVLI